MDGCGRMGSDDNFPIRQVLPIGTRFCCWAHWAWVFSAKLSNTVDTVNFYAYHHFFMAQGKGKSEQWVGDVVMLLSFFT